MSENISKNPSRCAMTVDVEDYFHVAAFESNIKVEDWGSMPSRVEKNTGELLRIFDEHNIRCTFFVLGWVAERHPELIKEISGLGHEIASHGYSHKLVYNQTPEVFREETKRSKNLLEDIVQKEVAGYRASSYSITRRSLWALDILIELGFRWDSSIFPVRHDRYGIPGTPSSPYDILFENGEKILEFPLTTADVAGVRIPAAGGGYFRLYPYWLSRFLLKRACSDKPGIFYLHPWEIDPTQPRIEDASRLSKFRHYNNLDVCSQRLERLIRDFQFSTVSDVLQEIPGRQSLDVNALQ